jgi:hypothetical protein
MQTIHEVARDFTAMLRAGQFVAAGDQFWATDVTSIEPADLPGGIRAIVSGVDATRLKCVARFGAARIDEIGIDGPFVTGNQFALFLDLVTVDLASGARQPFTEIALYTVRSGQIAEERYFYD